MTHIVYAVLVGYSEGLFLYHRVNYHISIGATFVTILSLTVSASNIAARS